MDQDNLEELEKQQLKRYNPVVSWVCWVMIVISAVTIAVMMFVSDADVVGRYFFSHPIKGTNELVGFMMVVAGFIGLGYCQLIKGNVMIDVLVNHVGRRGKSLLNVFSYLMSVAVCVLITWQGVLRSYDYMHRTLGSITILLSIKLWPFMLIMAVSFGWAAVIFLIDLYDALKEVFKR